MDRERLQQLEEQCIQNQPPACEAACPVHVAAKALSAAAAAGDWDEARREFIKAVPFPHVIARCCDAPCQTACVRKDAGGAIRIRDLERAVLAYGEDAPRRRRCAGRSRGSIAVVGAGMCGLSAAYELARKGYSVTVFEAEDEPGGRARDAGADVLPPDELAADVDKVVEAGAVIVTDTTVALAAPRGANALATLAPDADAILVAVGAGGGRRRGGARLPRRRARTHSRRPGHTRDEQVGRVRRRRHAAARTSPGRRSRPSPTGAAPHCPSTGNCRRSRSPRPARTVAAYATGLIVNLEGVEGEAPVAAAAPASGLHRRRGRRRSGALPAV